MAGMMAVIPMVMAEAGSEVTLVVPPPSVAEGKRREARLRVSPDWSELEGVGGAMARA